MDNLEEYFNEKFDELQRYALNMEFGVKLSLASLDKKERAVLNSARVFALNVCRLLDTEEQCDEFFTALDDAMPDLWRRELGEADEEWEKTLELWRAS